jgi:hypothetical protein
MRGGRRNIKIENWNGNWEKKDGNIKIEKWKEEMKGGRRNIKIENWKLKIEKEIKKKKMIISRLKSEKRK